MSIEPQRLFSKEFTKLLKETEDRNQQHRRITLFEDSYYIFTSDFTPLTTEVALEQLKALETLSPKQELDKWQQNLEGRYTQIEEEYLESYDAFMERKCSNPERKKNCKDSFVKNLKKTLKACKETFSPTPDWDDMRLAVEKRRLEERVNKGRGYESKGVWVCEANNIYEACQIDDAKYINRGIWGALGMSLDKRQKALQAVDEDGYAPIHYAAYHGSHAALNSLLFDWVDVKQPDREGYQAMHWAAKAGHEDIIISLFGRSFDHKADVNAKGKYDRTPLHMATFHGRLCTAKRLIETPGIDINAQTTKEGSSLTPLHNAVLNGDLLMVKLLASRDDLDPNIPDCNGRTPIYDAIEKGMASIVRILWDHPELDREKVDERAIREILAEEKTCL